MSTRTVVPSPKIVALREKLLAVIQAEAAAMRAEDILALVAHLLGQVVAMQDQRRFTSETVMQLVVENMETGNRSVVDDLLTKTGGTA